MRTRTDMTVRYAIAAALVVLAAVAAGESWAVGALAMLLPVYGYVVPRVEWSVDADGLRVSVRSFGILPVSRRSVPLEQIVEVRPFRWRDMLTQSWREWAQVYGPLLGFDAVVIRVRLPRRFLAEGRLIVVTPEAAALAESIRARLTRPGPAPR